MQFALMFIHLLTLGGFGSCTSILVPKTLPVSNQGYSKHGRDNQEQKGYSVEDPLFDAHPEYRARYAVTDAESGVYIGSEERRDGEQTRGSYQVALPDGRIQRVTYWVNGDSGTVTEVEYIRSGVTISRVRYGDPSDDSTSVVSSRVAHDTKGHRRQPHSSSTSTKSQTPYRQTRPQHGTGQQDAVHYRQAGRHGTDQSQNRLARTRNNRRRGGNKSKYNTRTGSNRSGQIGVSAHQDSHYLRNTVNSRRRNKSPGGGDAYGGSSNSRNRNALAGQNTNGGYGSYSYSRSRNSLTRPNTDTKNARYNSDDRDYTRQNSDDRDYTRQNSDDRDYTRQNSDDRDYTRQNRDYTRQNSDDRDYTRHNSDDRDYKRDNSDDRDYKRDNSDDRDYNRQNSDDRDYTRHNSDDRDYTRHNSDDRDYNRDNSDDRDYNRQKNVDRNYNRETTADRDYNRESTVDRDYTKANTDNRDYTRQSSGDGNRDRVEYVSREHGRAGGQQERYNDRGTSRYQPSTSANTNSAGPADTASYIQVAAPLYRYDTNTDVSTDNDYY